MMTWKQISYEPRLWLLVANGFILLAAVALFLIFRK